MNFVMFKDSVTQSPRRNSFAFSQLLNFLCKVRMGDPPARDFLPLLYIPSCI